MGELKMVCASRYQRKGEESEVLSGTEVERSKLADFIPQVLIPSEESL